MGCRSTDVAKSRANARPDCSGSTRPPHRARQLEGVLRDKRLARRGPLTRPTRPTIQIEEARNEEAATPGFRRAGPLFAVVIERSLRAEAGVSARISAIS